MPYAALTSAPSHASCLATAAIGAEATVTEPPREERANNVKSWCPDIYLFFMRFSYWL